MAGKVGGELPARQPAIRPATLNLRRSILTSYLDPRRLEYGQRPTTLRGNPLRKQYLHLSIYLCDRCSGPVVAGSLAVRESEISKETEIGQVGTICLSCGHRPEKAGAATPVRHLSPVEWQPMNATRASLLATV